MAPDRAGAGAGAEAQRYNRTVRIITTHLSADFDAFAAAVCAVHLYPGYEVLFPGSLEAAVRRFMGEVQLPPDRILS